MGWKYGRVRVILGRLLGFRFTYIVLGNQENARDSPISNGDLVKLKKKSRNSLNLTLFTLI